MPPIQVEVLAATTDSDVEGVFDLAQILVQHPTQVLASRALSTGCKKNFQRFRHSGFPGEDFAAQAMRQRGGDGARQ
jgi:hypothetical protein